MMRKIERVLISNHFPLEGSGSGTYTKEVAGAIQRLGIDVVVLVVGSTTTTADLDVRSIGYEDGSFPAFTTHDQQQTPLRFNQMTKEQTEMYVQSWRRGLSGAIKTFKPNAAHLGHAWVAAGIAFSVLETQDKIPLVTTVHGTEIKGFEVDPINKRLTGLARRGHRATKASIAISSYIQGEAHEKLGIPLKKLPISPNGFNPDIFERNPAIDREEVLRQLNLERLADAIIVYTSGKFAEFKRHDRTIGAIAKASQFLPNIHLIHCGGGEEQLKQQLIEYAKRLRILDRIHFLGPQPQSTMNNVANISAIAVFVSDNEPFGLVALEAQATGTPVIVTNSGGFPDFVNNRVGRLVEPDEASVATALVEEITSNAKQAKGLAAAQHAQSFTWDHHVEPIIEIWRRYS